MTRHDSGCSEPKLAANAWWFRIAVRPLGVCEFSTNLSFHCEFICCVYTIDWSFDLRFYSNSEQQVTYNGIEKATRYNGSQMRVAAPRGGYAPSASFDRDPIAGAHH